MAPKDVSVMKGIIISATGYRRINGLSNRYSEVMPSALKGIIPFAKYATTMSTINTLLQENFPPSVRCMCKKDGDAVCPKLVQTRKVLKKLRDLLGHENHTIYEPYSVRWHLHRRQNFLRRRLEFVIEVTYTTKISCPK